MHLSHQWLRTLLAGFVVVGIGTSSALGDLVTSFETGDFDGWTAPDVNGSPSAVNTNRASDGVYSTESSFTVPAAWVGWGVHTLLSKGTADIGITSSTAEISLDAYADGWTNPNGWGIYGNQIWLILNYEGVWTTIEPSSGSLTNGVFTTITFDISEHAAAMSDPGLSYSSVEIVWFFGTWQEGDGDDGLDNGTQTISIDNISLTNIPEPGSLALLGLGGIVMMVRSRKSVSAAR